MRKVRAGRLSGWCIGVVLAAAVAVAGCAVPNRSSIGTRPSFAPPLPIGVQDPAKRPSQGGPAPTDDCNARASLRPPASMPRPGSMPARSTMRKIADRGRLIVGTDQNNYLFGYRDPISGEIVGFDVDVTRQIAKAIFGTADDSRLQVVTLASDERIAAVQTGQVDIVAETMTINCERLEKVAFSTVYYEAEQKILTSRNSDITDLTDLAGRKVCAARGSTSINNVALKAPTARIVSVKYWTDCLVLLQQGQAEAITTDDTILSGLAAQDPNVKLVGAGFNPEPYGLAMSKSAPDFVRFVNGVLDRMRQDGSWKQIYASWLPAPVPAPPAPQYRD
jgi:polar amino acid transport system substrate-binding protein